MRNQNLISHFASLSLLCCSQAFSGEDCVPSPAPYPTVVVADYVIGCMMSNGQSPDNLRKCACSIDFIASAMPYDEYEKAETLLRLQQVPGAGRNASYRNTAWSRNVVGRLREVQAESTLRCF